MKEKGSDFSKKDVLAEMNKIIAANKDQYPWIEKNPNFLKEGMQLKLPESQAATPESSKGRTSSNAMEELNNLSREAKESSNLKGKTSSTSVEELNVLSRNSSEGGANQSRSRSSSTSVEEARAFWKGSKIDKARPLGKESSTSVEELKTLSGSMNSVESYNIGVIEFSNSTLSSRKPGIMSF